MSDGSPFAGSARRFIYEDEVQLRLIEAESLHKVLVKEVLATLRQAKGVDILTSKNIRDMAFGTSFAFSDFSVATNRVTEVYL